MNKERPAYLYYHKSYRTFQNYVTIEKLFEPTITNCNISMTSQTSSPNIAIKNGKQPNNRLPQKIVEYTR